METNELKNIWETLAKEKLIDKELAKENIERIITLKSSKTIDKLLNKLKVDRLTHIVTAIFIITVTIFATVFLHERNQQLPAQGYIFLVLIFSFYAIKSLNINTKIKLLKLSFCTSSILDSLKNVKNSFGNISRKETCLTYSAIAILTVFANVLINDKTDFSNFNMNSLQGYVFIFSIFYLISLPWTGKYFFKKRFSVIIDDINKSILELSSEDK